ncbi:alpha/beta-Hydrolase [Glarea lozoyensis ATCC 20868]|uniref:Alpha/beta-Hydrolase n=1 Tax=Glarea lozoyensis (strain ATCC 20868 / MF5171) TaxID=1116229 RepID=S3CT71_GLAL2|nr:alpha/beta-Hydrolase [Glarea lozoyensis ATCC 20868]EPE28830.1 alpha/beta-Hydrolase [Glarea lozoyensis ATCC 20868]
MPSLKSLAEYHTYVEATFQEQAKEVLCLYPAATDTEVQRATSQLLADQCFVWPTWTSARLQIKNLKSQAWYYKFLAAPIIPQDLDVIEKKHAGAFHGVGVAALSKDFLGALVRFLQTGSPSDADSWPAVDANGGLIMNWDSNSSKVKPSGERLNKISMFWDTYYGIKGDI